MSKIATRCLRKRPCSTWRWYSTVSNVGLSHGFRFRPKLGTLRMFGHVSNNDTIFWHIQILVSRYLVHLPPGGTVGLQDATSKLGNEALAQLSTLKKCKKRQLLFLYLLYAVLTFRICPWLKRSLFVYMELHEKTFFFLARFVFVLHCCRRHRESVLLIDCGYLENWHFLWNCKLNINWTWNTGLYRIVGSGATAQSISNCLLVATTSFPLFHNGMQSLRRGTLSWATSQTPRVNDKRRKR